MTKWLAYLSFCQRKFIALTFFVMRRPMSKSYSTMFPARFNDNSHEKIVAIVSKCQSHGCFYLRDLPPPLLCSALAII
jgi:hypothetical protein